MAKVFMLGAGASHAASEGQLPLTKGFFAEYVSREEALAEFLSREFVGVPKIHPEQMNMSPSEHDKWFAGRVASLNVEDVFVFLEHLIAFTPEERQLRLELGIVRGQLLSYLNERLRYATDD